MILKLGMKHLGTEVYKICMGWHWDDLDLFHGKVNLGR